MKTHGSLIGCSQYSEWSVSVSIRSISHVNMRYVTGNNPLGSPSGRAVTEGDWEGIAALLTRSVLAALVHLSQRERQGVLIQEQAQQR